jgi:hypothetical protein
MSEFRNMQIGNPELKITSTLDLSGRFTLSTHSFAKLGHIAFGSDLIVCSSETLSNER